MAEELSKTDILVHEIIEGEYQLFTDQFDVPCIIDNRFPLIAKKINSLDTKNLLVNLYWGMFRKAIRTEIVSSVILTLNGLTSQNEKKEVFTRVARIEDDIYYDIGDNIHVVKINKDGWNIQTDAPIYFRRYTHQIPQVLPQRGGNLRNLIKYIHIEDEVAEILLCTYLPTCLICNIERPLILMNGPEGAGKTSALEFIKSLIDPSQLKLLKLPNSEEDLIIQANRHYAYFMDNLSKINKTLSDNLCRLVTGSSFSKRVLYTDDDEFLYEFKRVTGFTSIAQIASSADLLNRSLIIPLDLITEEKRISDEELNIKFQEEKPLIFGALLDIVSKTLSSVNELNFTSLPRMADYYRYATAASIHLGYGVEKFIQAYDQNKSQQVFESIETSSTVQVILIYMKGKPECTETSTRLFIDLKTIASEFELESGFPKGVNGLWKKIQESKMTLLSIGIETSRGRDESARYITLKKTEKYKKDLDNSILDFNPNKPWGDPQHEERNPHPYCSLSIRPKKQLAIVKA